MKRISLIILLSMVLVSPIFSHKGGHSHEANHIISREWKFADHSPAGSGSLLMVRDGLAYIENKDGIQRLDIASLSWMDQKYIQRKKASVHELNQPINKTPLKGPILTPERLILPTIVLFLLALIFVWKRNKLYNHRTTYVISSFALLVILVACSKDDDPEPDSEDPITELKTGENDPEEMVLAFAAFSTSTTSFDDDYFYVESEGLPEHQMMVGITEWIAQVPVPHEYTGDDAWVIPLKTEYSAEPVTITEDLRRGAVAVAVNGIPIFNPVNASGVISYEIGELDEFGGHSGRGDDYHYHIAPLHLANDNLPVAFAFDGYPIYGSTEPDGSGMEALDEFNGHEDEDGDFHYHGTTSYPYLFEKMRGVVTLEGSSPETQIEPQPVAQAFRGDPYPISTENLIITDLQEKPGGMGYVLTYEQNGVEGSVDYSWDENNFYTFVFYDTDGTVTTETFQRNGGDGPMEPPSTDDFILTSEAVVDGELLDDYKCEEKVAGKENSIPLSWSNVPEGTGSLAVIMHHYPNPDDQSMPPNSYLLLWDIDPSVTEIAYGEADGGPWFMGANKDGNNVSYSSPCSPSAGSHTYTITLYALDETPSSLPQESTVDVDYDVLYEAIQTVTTIGTAVLEFDDVNE